MFMVLPQSFSLSTFNLLLIISCIMVSGGVFLGGQ